MGDGTLAYVFWHWRRPEVEAAAYEARQRAFHAALAGAGEAWYGGSLSFQVPAAPWEGGPEPACEDWYFVEGFGALGSLNERAVSGSVSAPHDAAAAAAAGGAGGLYALRAGRAWSRAPAPAWAGWLGKPQGVGYAELLADLSPRVEAAGGTLWLRQMVLGPAPELCVHAPSRLDLPAGLEPSWLPLRPLWPEPAPGAGGE